MSWFRSLAETYDRLPQGVLPSPNHTMKNTDICVTIDNMGQFIRAEKSKQNIVIPFTEEAAGRTSTKIAAYPLHEQLGYFTDERKRGIYLEQLGEWKSLHPKIEAVYNYILNNTIIADLRLCDIETDNLKLFVRFSVQISGDLELELWNDDSAAKAWDDFCDSTQSGNKTMCYVLGEMLPNLANHAKVSGNAKLISCNDDTNYTYRGRFTSTEQANAISSKVSNKAHALLKYLITTQAYKCDSQAIMIWAVDDGKAAANPFADSMSLYDEAEPADQSIAVGGELGADYAKRLRTALASKGGTKALELSEYGRRIAILAVDAATTGRMAVTFYKDLPENEYIERIVNWHESCRWHFHREGKDCVYAPSADKIIAAVYGEPRSKDDNSYKKIKKQARERILNFMLNGERIDKSWVHCAVNRVSNPFSYDKQDGGWDKHKWENAINVTCAIVRKYYSNEEEIALELDTGCTERSYLYGRLLAIADKVESHARYLQTGKSDTDKRPTNAVRYMTRFSTKPFSTWSQIYQQLSPYLQRLNGAEWYQRQIDEVMSLFSSGDYESDKCLDGRYLMGYSLQRKAYRNNNEEETENAEQED